MKTLSCFRSAVLRLACAILLVDGAGAALAQTAPVPPSALKVTKLIGEFAVGYDITVKIDNLGAWSASQDATKLVPYINGRGIRGCYPVEISASRNEVHFKLVVTAQSRDAWSDVLGPLKDAHRIVEFSVGLEGKGPFDTDVKTAEFTVIPEPYGWISLVVVAAVLIALILLAQKTPILRDSGPDPGAGKLRPYSLGRVQMAFWFCLSFASYIAIWLITDAIDSITPSLVGLMGISATTAVSGFLIDKNKAATATAFNESAVTERAALEKSILEAEAQLAALTAKTTPSAEEAKMRDDLNRLLLEQRARRNLLAQQLAALAAVAGSNVSRGFFRDVLSDNDGYSFHRFQIFGWTIALGGIFISSVYNDIVMPEYSATMLSLMGMSAGTYLGFKFPESR